MGCKFSTLEELLTIDISESIKKDLIKTFDKYRIRDVNFLYFVSSVFIFLIIGTLFKFNSVSSCNSNGDVICNICFFITCFSFLVLAMRIHFFRFYLENPIIAHFNQKEANCWEITRNLIYTFFGFICVGLMLLF